MDALKFIQERNRMCIQFSPGCGGCPISEERLTWTPCLGWTVDNPEKAIQVVEKWSEENPRKTRQSVLLEQWPNAVLDDGVLHICPKNVLGKTPYNNGKYCVLDCGDCRRDFWLKEVD